MLTGALPFRVAMVRTRYIVLVHDGVSGRLFVTCDPGKDLKPAFLKYVKDRHYTLFTGKLEQKVIERMVCTRREADTRISHLSRRDLSLALQVLLI